MSISLPMNVNYMLSSLFPFFCVFNCNIVAVSQVSGWNFSSLA